MKNYYLMLLSSLMIWAPSLTFAIPQPSTECFEDTDCPEGETCYHLDGLQVPCEVDDMGNEICPGDEIPVSGICGPIEEGYGCESDADCDEGERCEYFETSVICEVDDMGNERCEEFIGEGECFPYEEAGPPCESDSDCPSHLRCLELPWVSEAPEMEAVDCAEEDCGESFAPPCEGEGCEGDPLPPPPPSEEMMCVYEEIECASDDECPENFYCAQYEYSIGCPEIACPEGEDCPEIDCPEETEVYQACAPNEIECDSDEACPADWSCETFTHYDECGRETSSGSAGSPDGSATDPDSAPSPDPEEAPAPEGVEEDEAAREGQFPVEEDCAPEAIEERSLCVPNGLSVYEVADTATGNGELGGEEVDPTTGGTEEGGGDDDPVEGGDDENAGGEESGGESEGGGEIEAGEDEIPVEGGESTGGQDSAPASSDEVEDSGCSARPSAGAQPLALLIGLIGILARRRWVVSQL